MVAKGVIIATSSAEARRLRILAFDRWWLDTSPRSIHMGGVRGMLSEPVLMIYGLVDWRSLMNELRPVFQYKEPEVFQIRKLEWE